MVFAYRRLVLLAIGLALLPRGVWAAAPNDARFDEQWYLDRIQAPAAWEVTTGDDDVVVAVLDTGVDLDHEDLSNNIWMNAGEVADNGKDDDRNGFVDDVVGWDFVRGDNMPTPEWALGYEDVASHGTVIAGLIGAEGDNGIGMAGVSWDVRIMSLRVLDSQGSGNDRDVARAVRYATANGADVVNLSFAGYSTTTELSQAIQEAYRQGVVVVAAMGNDAVDTDNSPVYPACLGASSEDWVIGVASSDRADAGSPFTNFGKTCTDLSAPGEDIHGLFYVNEDEGFTEAYGGPWEGTSVASPLVAGAAAILLSEYPWLTPQQIRDVIKLSVDPVTWFGFGRGELGAGRLNIARALEYGASFAPADDGADRDDEPVIEVVDDEETEEAIPPQEQTKSPYLSASFVAFGAPSGVMPMIEVYRADGTPYAAFQAFTVNFSGGVNVAMADLNGDAIPEVIAGADETGGPHVRVFKAYGAVVSEFFAYALDSSHGVDVAAGDVNADGYEDIVTAVGAGVSKDIVVWTMTGEEIMRFTADAFADGVPLQVDLVDFDDDWQLEFAVATRGEVAPQIAVYDHDGTYLASFTPFTETTGISLASYDANGDYYDDIAVASLGDNDDIRMFTKVGVLTAVKTVDLGSRGMRIASVDVDFNGLDEMFALEDADAGQLSILNFTSQEAVATWYAPSFGATRGPFFAAW